MTPHVKDHMETAYVNCIDELHELKIYKSADEEINETLNRYHFPNSVRRHVYKRSILPTIKTKAYIAKILKKMDEDHLKEISDITIDPINRYREDFFKWCVFYRHVLFDSFEGRCWECKSVAIVV